MYPMQCHGGFYVPLRAGKYEVLGMSCVVNTTTSDSRVVLIDDEGITDDKFGRILATTHDEQKGLVDIKGLGLSDSILEQFFPEPVKVRKGLSAVETTNIVPGTLKVYVR